MADEELATVPAELETAPPPEQETVEAPEPEIDPETGEPVASEDDGYEDLEFDGKSYRLPKELKGAFMRNKDYTEGKQSVAETRRTLEARQAEIEERAKVTDEELELKADIKSVTKTMAQMRYAEMTTADWAALEAENPLASMQHWRNFQMLKDQKAELEGKLGQASKQRTDKASQDLEKRIQDTLAEAPKIIPGWKAEAAADTMRTLATFAASLDISEQTLKSNWSPQLLKLLHLGRIGHLATQKQATPKPKADPPQPLKTVTAKSAPTTGLSDKLSADEWVKRRNAQVTRRP